MSIKCQGEYSFLAVGLISITGQKVSLISKNAWQDICLMYELGSVLVDKVEQDCNLLYVH